MKPTIKAYVGYSERSNTHYYRDFEIVFYLPSVGDEIDGWEVKDVTPVNLDCEQGSDRVYDYDYYEIEMLDSIGLEFDPIGTPDHYKNTLYYAIRKEEEDEVVATRENFKAFADAETTDHVITVTRDGVNYFKSVSSDEWNSFCEYWARNLLEMEWTLDRRNVWEDKYGLFGYTATEIAWLMYEATEDGDEI
jgi:hypothetical protein